MPSHRFEFAPCIKDCCREAVRRSPNAASTASLDCPDCHRALSHHEDSTLYHRWHAHPLYRECEAVPQTER